ncbi:MauE/DoxX family redox-associated membrane protein [Agriterribacter sp.]|uniref:MauE/DoxX family redox-associated membrane protein n=1 Tax=Agriterribacter sp. TaxID=2821509 RepID=UPI002CD6471C|nr:MauE/DoxX family redox-associated membrane protein [Agriterribacter sp.]HTN05689.1 MauE/DoxX family redox-associated membrane protein [Agriterribacter sp.]
MILEIYQANECNMSLLLKNTRIADIISGIFIILFTYTAVNKLIDYSTFRIALVQSPVLVNYADFMAVAVPAVELLIVVLLVFSATRKAGLFFSLIMMVAFTLYVSYLMFFASELPCNCGGIIKALTWKQHLIVNVILVAFAAWAWLVIKSNKNIIAINRNSRTLV